MVFGLFRRDNANTAPNPIIPAPKPFHELLSAWVDDLDWYVRESSNLVSNEVFSRLRVISDVFREVNAFIIKYNVRAEEEYILKSTVTQYIPDALNLFNQLSAADRAPGKNADRMLLDQCDNIERSIRELNESMHARVRSDLAAQTQFVEDRFTQPI